MVAVQKVLDDNYTLTVPVFKLFHNQIIGKGGVTIKKIREATKVRIDFPDAHDASDEITVTGNESLPSCNIFTSMKTNAFPLSNRPKSKS